MRSSRTPLPEEAAGKRGAPLKPVPRSTESVEADLDGQDGAGSRIKSLSMTIRILTEMARAGHPLGVTELARRVGEGKARIHRHLQTLRDAGLLSQSDADERYRLGWMLFELGQAAAAQFDIAEIAAPVMRELRDISHLTVILGQRDGDEVMILHTLESDRLIAVTARKGLRLPARQSAMGRLMLAYATPADQQRLLRVPASREEDSQRFTNEEIRSRLVHIRERRFEISEGESPSGIYAISAPILDSNLNLVAMLGVVGTQSQLGGGGDRKLIDLVLRCSARVGDLLISGKTQ